MYAFCVAVIEGAEELICYPSLLNDFQKRSRTAINQLNYQGMQTLFCHKDFHIEIVELNILPFPSQYTAHKEMHSERLAISPSPLQ